MATQTETTELTDGDGVHVSARQWQDRNGNTYHTVRVTLFRDDGNAEKYGTAEKVYGYGAYMQTARKLLEEIGAFDVGGEPGLTHALRKSGIAYAEEALGVQRKKDLHDNLMPVSVTAIDRV